MFFISDAFAEGGTAQSGGLWPSFLPVLAFIAILYFLLIKPQQKRQKEHQSLVASIKKGDKVITNSGLIATVSKVINDHEVVLEIAHGVHCKFVKSTISSVLNQANSSLLDKPTSTAQNQTTAMNQNHVINHNDVVNKNDQQATPSEAQKVDTTNESSPVIEEPKDKE